MNNSLILSSRNGKLISSLSGYLGESIIEFDGIAKLKQMRYFKYKWNETRGDQYDNWGHSLWYIEIGEDDFPNRQIEIYDNGKILKYSQDLLEDQFGGLGDLKLDLSEFDGIECTEMEFEENWNR